MKAMILAAGLGSRLKPITDKIPKALVPVEGVPMLARLISKLKDLGFEDIIVNTHHFSDQIKDFLANEDFGIEIKTSDELENLLDTGGGIVKAFPLLFNKNEKRILFHNVDILSNADLKNVLSAIDEKTGAVLLISDRESSRKLLFDEEMLLQGWHDVKGGYYKPQGFLPSPEMKEFAFSGIYAMSKRGVEEMKEIMGQGKFSVMEYFLHPKRSLPIKGFLQSDLKLLDIGKPATLSQASELLKEL